MNNNWWAQESSINQNPSFSGSISWRRQWHPTPVLLPGKSHGWRNLEGCSHGVAECRTRLSDFTSLFTFMHWRRKWQPTPVFLPGESQGREAWWAAIYGVAQSRTRLKWRSSSSSSRELVMDSEAWHAGIHGLPKSRTRLSDWTESGSRVCALQSLCS